MALEVQMEAWSLRPACFKVEEKALVDAEENPEPARDPKLDVR